MDIVQAVGNLIAGADDKTVRTLAQVVVDRYSKLMGEAYILAPTCAQSCRLLRLSGCQPLERCP